MTGETIASMVAAVHYLAPVLIGRETGDFAGARAAMVRACTPTTAPDPKSLVIWHF